MTTYLLAGGGTAGHVNPLLAVADRIRATEPSARILVLGTKEGLEVQEGDVIGFVGTTGNAPPNTPHLHFQVMRSDANYWNGTPIDVRTFMTKQGRMRN